MTSEETVSIRVDQARIEGSLRVPERPGGVVLFAHGSGSSRFSPRNRHVAELLESVGLATLLVDLLTAEEEEVDNRSGELRFDVRLLADRLLAAATWLRGNAETASLPLGYFGASTGAGAALVAAAERPELVRAVVSRGGRPDLAAGSLAHVRAPTLLIVGGCDLTVLELNRRALIELPGEKKLEIISGATHLFEEAGALDAVARLAGDWFLSHLYAAS